MQFVHLCESKVFLLMVQEVEVVIRLDDIGVTLVVATTAGSCRRQSTQFAKMLNLAMCRKSLALILIGPFVQDLFLERK